MQGNPSPTDKMPTQAAETDPVLCELDGVLGADPLYQQVCAKLDRLTGGARPGEVLLRMLLVKHLYGWSEQQTSEQVADSLVLRWFCRVAFHEVPDASTLWRWEQMLRPETVHALNDRVVQLAAQARVTKGRKLRLDATCVQTNIHHPTDSGLLVDSVRVRLPLRAARQRVAQRASKQCAPALSLAAALRPTSGSNAPSSTAAQSRGERNSAAGAVPEAHPNHGADGAPKSAGPRSAREADRATGQAARARGASRVLPLVERVITQTRTRVLEGKKMAAGEKVLSLFEPHTRAIPRHKGGALVEFGRHVILDEVEGGIVAHHQALFEHPPGLVAGDRGVQSAETEERLKAAGVKRVAIPAAGKLSQQRRALERTRAWRRGYRWRAGIEGRIASLRRDYGWRKSAYHGPDGMERWLGLGVIASNLRRIALAK